jgi:hypothetical protein
LTFGKGRPETAVVGILTLALFEYAAVAAFFPAWQLVVTAGPDRTTRDGPIIFGTASETCPSRDCVASILLDKIIGRLNLDKPVTILVVTRPTKW